MARKFKVGDKVEVVRQYGDVGLSCRKGRVGIILSYYDGRSLYPYGVRFANKDIRYFNARGLEKMKCHI